MPECAEQMYDSHGRPAHKSRFRLCAEIEHMGPALHTLVDGFTKYNKLAFEFTLLQHHVSYASQVCMTTADTILSLIGMCSKATQACVFGPVCRRPICWEQIPCMYGSGLCAVPNKS